MIETKMKQGGALHASDSGTDLSFALMREAFADAKRLHPRAFRESWYVLAGQPVLMRIVGRKLAELMHLPFAHLRAAATSSTDAGLTIELWDQTETGVVCRIGSLRDDLDLHPILKRSPDGRYVSYQLQHSLACLDRQSAFMVGCASNAEDLSLYERGRPLHVPLSVWHKSRGIPVVHAGLVSKSGCGLLLAGPGGSGKSTSAITAAFSGFEFLSDDLVGLEASASGGFVGHSLYSSTFMEPDHLTRFALPKRPAITPRYPFEKKHLVLLSQIESLRFARACRIDAVVLPRVLHLAAARLRPASKGEALMALAPSSLLVGERSDGVQGFRKLAALVEQVPSYRLELGGPLDVIPRVLEETLSGAVHR